MDEEDTFFNVGQEKKKGKVSEEAKSKKEEESRKLRRIVDDNLNIEDFITEVEKCPSIWKIDNISYSNKNTKLNDWIMIICTFIPNYEEYTKPQREDILKFVIAKWKHLRGCYTREILKQKEEQKSGTCSSRRKPYLYFEQMRFLETSKKSTDDSILDSDKNEDEVTGEDNTDPEIPKTRQYMQREEKSKEKEEEEILYILTKRLAEKNMRRKKDEADGDKLFLLSLLPEMKKVTPEKKLKLKSDMLSLIASAQSFQTHMQPQTSCFGIPQYNIYNPGPVSHQYSTVQEINPLKILQGNYLENSKSFQQSMSASTVPSNIDMIIKNQIQQALSNSAPTTNAQQQHHNPQSKPLDIRPENNPILLRDQTISTQQTIPQSTSRKQSHESSISPSISSSVSSSPGSEVLNNSE